MRYLILFLLALSYGAVFCQQTQPTPATALTDALHKFNKAFQDGDVKTLEAMITEDYVHTNGYSKAIMKQDWLSYLSRRSEDIRLGRLEVIDYKMDEIDMKFYDNMAIVTGIVTVTNKTDDNSTTNHYRVTHIWVKQDNMWKRAGFHDGKVR